MNDTYRAYLESDQWKAVRLRKLKAVGERCEVCGNPSVPGKPLQVHHRHYRTLYNERNEDLQVLCVPCHAVADQRRKAHLPPLKSLVALFQKKATAPNKPKKKLTKRQQKLARLALKRAVRHKE